jgi:hypothetical protein
MLRTDEYGGVGADADIGDIFRVDRFIWTHSAGLRIGPGCTPVNPGPNISAHYGRQ